MVRKNCMICCLVHVEMNDSFWIKDEAVTALHCRYFLPTLNLITICDRMNICLISLKTFACFIWMKRVALFSKHNICTYMNSNLSSIPRSYRGLLGMFEVTLECVELILHMYRGQERPRERSMQSHQNTSPAVWLSDSLELI